MSNHGPWIHPNRVVSDLSGITAAALAQVAGMSNLDPLAGLEHELREGHLVRHPFERRQRRLIRLVIVDLLLTVAALWGMFRSAEQGDPVLLMLYFIGLSAGVVIAGGVIGTSESLSLWWGGVRQARRLRPNQRLRTKVRPWRR